MTSWYDYPGAILGYTEAPLLRWLQANVKPGETWIDVGAHYGYTAIALSELVGVRGRVYAFEPVLATAGYLSRTRALNHLEQLTVIPLALGDCSGLSTVEVPLVRGMADHAAKSSTLISDKIIAVAFDDIWPSIAQPNTAIDGIKIDVQGMEPAVLAGMQNTMSQARPVLALEIHQGVNATALLQQLHDMGYGIPGEPIDYADDSSGTQGLDDRSYCFRGR